MFNAVVRKSLSLYETHRALSVPGPIVYSLLTNVYRNVSDAALLFGRIAEAESVVMSLVAFLRTVQYSPDSCFAHDQMKSTCAG